jgi:prepilin-type N-terminal cleavage/methylation domain-containing protein
MGKQLISIPAKPRRGFVLLEVMVAVLIIGVALVALLRGFIISLDQLKRIRYNEQAILLAKSLMDDMVLEPPAEGRFEGNFGDDPRFGEEFAEWHWRVEVQVEEPDYEARPKGTLFQEMEEVYYMQVEILREETVGRENRQYLYLDLHTIAMESDIFSTRAIQGNQLF